MSQPGALLLGVDTGGTYTDAVVYVQGTRTLLGKAKAETTHDDLSIGIDAAIDAALRAASADSRDISLVSLSTTLATNALVEKKGRAACLVSIGFTPHALDRAGLREALGADSVIFVRGGHTSHGTQVEPLDVSGLVSAVGDVADSVDAFAVTAQFSVRNPEHELAAKDLITAATAKPVTCSHYLSTKLNGPKRAVTALLNARLIGLIEDLITTTVATLHARDIFAPVMVVRGDGSLVSAEFVLDRPVETILSGPAASIIGAHHLVGEISAVVCDIGGTTTDIAVLSDGRPKLAASGAVVGGHRTMVEAVAIHTDGLGGDSQITVAPRASKAELLIGPRRVVPLCLLATHEPQLVRDVLDRQLDTSAATELSGVIVSVPSPGGRAPQLTRHERELIDRVGDQFMAADTLVTSNVLGRSLVRLIDRGLMRATGFTPTDASHVLGHQSNLDTEVAEMAASLFARRRDYLGRVLGIDGRDISRKVVTIVSRRTAEMVLAAAFVNDGLPADLATSALVESALDRSVSTTRLGIGLSVPLVALGAPASIYYPMVSDLLESDLIVPEHGDVANAIGAAVALIRISHHVVISAPRRGLFRVHIGTEPPTVSNLDEAKTIARIALMEKVTADMHTAGATEFETTESWDETNVEVEARQMFVEGLYRISASGRPDLGRPNGDGSRYVS